MSSRDTKIKRTLLESGLGLLVKEYEKNPSYGHTRVHDNMVPWALRALGTKMKILSMLGLVLSENRKNSFPACKKHQFVLITKLVPAKHKKSPNSRPCHTVITIIKICAHTGQHGIL